MRAIWTIAFKDFKSMVFSPMFLLIGGFCASIWSYNYLRAIMQFAAQSAMSAMHMGAPQSMNIHYSVFIAHISFVNIIFIFAIPALTMRLLAEEKKVRTYDLLLTAPITSTQIAIGKFLAGYGSAMALVALSLIYPLGTMFFADFQIGPLLTSYAGLALITGAYVAVGLFSSSLTQSVVLSVVMGLIFNLILWFISQGTSFSDAPVFTAVMEQLSIGQHLFGFLKGTIKLSSLAFFLTCMALFVFLSQRVIESSRWR